METRSLKRRKVVKELALEEDKEDRISNLPDEVLHQIFTFLPIKSIAQNSILSKRWHHLWKSIPDLDFTTVSSLTPSTSMGRNKKRLHAPPTSLKGTEFLLNVLSLRDKTNFDIRVFRLSSYLSFTGLNNLIRLALKRNVQELDIEVATNDYFNLPRSVIRSASLTVFKLKSRFPGFRLPPPSIMKSGFRLLHTLSLCHVILHDQPKLVDLFTDASFPLLRRLSLDAGFGLSCLYVGSQGLQELVLENCSQLNQLEVKALKLKGVRIVNCFDAYSNDSWFKIVAPELRVMVWEYNALVGEYEMGDLSSLEEAALGFMVPDEGISVDKFWAVGNLMSGLSQANSLTLQSHCVEILSIKNQSGIAISNDPFTSLGILELYTGCNRRNVTGLAQLFKSSPSLHTLIVNVIDNDKTQMRQQWNRELWGAYAIHGKRFWESQCQALNPFLSSLKVVKIYGFSECEDKISLVMFLLRHGKALQEMILIGSRKRNRNVTLPSVNEGLIFGQVQLFQAHVFGQN